MKKQLTKQELRDKQEKKQRILKFVKRSINIVCYCLSVLFLILCVAVGVQSCNSKNDKQNKSYRTPLNDISLRAQFTNDDFIYTCILDVGTQRISVDFQQNVIGSNLNLSAEYSSAQSRRFFNYHFDEGVYIIANNGNYIEVEYFLLSFTSYITRVDSSTNYYSYRMDKAWFRDYNGTDYAILNYTGSSNIFNQNSYNVLNSMVNRIVSSSYDVTNNYFRSFYLLVDDPLIFNFNNDINYNAPYSGSLTNPYLGDASSSDALINHLYYDFNFICFGKFFNRIDYQYAKTVSGQYFMFDDGKTHQSSGSELYFIALYYVNTFTGESVLVNQRNQVAFYLSNGGLAHYWDLGSTWTSQYYRDIKLLNYDNDTLLDLSKFNNATGSASGVSHGNIGLSNVFNLLSTSFSALINLFTIQIIPGLTIGVLIFLPLVVTIIILVFKAVKK